MDEVNLQQAIQLSKDGRKIDARKLLRPLLEVDPESEKAWLWYANSFDSTDEKLKA
jgi:Tfp pilus assembly protein PilF